MVVYSAADAPIAWTNALFVAPHLDFGSALLLATLRKKVWLRGMSGTVGLVVQFMAGALFFGVATKSIASDVQQASACRTAAATRQATALEGPVVVSERCTKPGYSYIRFSVEGHTLRTETVGLSGDCGFLQPLGKIARINEGEKVKVLALGEKVVLMERIE